MATQSWSSRVRHDSDATFREWGSELAGYLAAAGLVQTADTGQINWATVTRPGINTDGGYEIWRMDDAAQGTAPVYFRIGYGTEASADGPRIRITVGTGTNGAGTITGIASSARQINENNGQTTDTTRQSYLCVNEGFFGLSWKIGTGATEGGFFFCRTCDADGTPNVDGALASWSEGSNSGFTGRQAFRYAATAASFTATVAPETGALGLAPQAPTGSIVGSDIQVYAGWTITPRVQPLFGVCGVFSSELSPGGTFSATVVGSTARTYITLTDQFGPFGPIAANAAAGGLNVAMLWE
jgi:hypothetical protein